MLFTISKFIANLFGLDISVVQKRVILATIILITVAVLVSGLWLRSCFKKTEKLDIKNIEKINKANETERLKEFEKVIRENEDTVKTVDGRNVIAELSEEAKQAQIYAKIREVDAKFVEAKSATGKDVTSEELQCLYVPENCK